MTKYRTRNGVYDAEIVYALTGIAPRVNTTVKLTHRQMGYSELCLYYDGGLYVGEPDHPMDIVPVPLFEVGKTYKDNLGLNWLIIYATDQQLVGAYPSSPNNRLIVRTYDLDGTGSATRLIPND